ncbi:hypothetical protein Scep_002962 [Stephania cephalantha]|uniref:Bifunctional inhibitor/plant lipid transfer protein/seed storage helical domain-containing protein n=1 Tax=Stephania cephalantha TaxID=152367 RepID=A0AAP0Q9A4_9MAGN
MKVKRGMSSAMIHHVTLVMLLVFALPIQTVQGGLSHAECKLLVNILVSACSEVINRKPPSAYCCQRIRVTPEECVCPRITPQLAVLIAPNLNYAVKVVQGCGRPVPRHHKCGSITTP